MWGTAVRGRGKIVPDASEVVLSAAAALMREPVEFGYAAAEIARFNGIGGERKAAVVTLKCFPVASHATEQVARAE